MPEPRQLLDKAGPPLPNAGRDGVGRARDPAPTTARSGDRFAELRALLVDPERERLARIEKQLANPNLNAEGIAQVLPEAIARRVARDNEVGAALGPVVGDAIRASVRRDPQPLVDAIFPVMGPAIRRAIATALSELVQSLNTTLEHTFSLRGLSWRLEAMRTGKSFGEVVLSHSLLFRVEQLFVIHRESGLLIEHRTAPNVQAPSPDMVASMMTALRDFARDSFRVSEQESLDSLALGDLTVWAESGPSAILAAVIRGHAPIALREELQRAVEAIHRVHANDIDRFADTGVAFPVREGILERCLVSQTQQRSTAGAGGWRLALAAAVILGAVGWCAVPRALEQRRFNAFVDQLRREPGVVIGSSGRAGGRFVVTGLRDPLARDPATLLAAAGVDSADVDAKWEPYAALRPEFVLRRASAALAPPPPVSLAMRGDTLVATGVAPARWVDDAARVGRAVPGVSVVRLDALRDSAYVALAEQARAIESTVISFALGITYPMGAERARVDTLSRSLRQLAAGAASARRGVRVEIFGSADSVGGEGVNSALRAARSATIRAMLVTRGVEPSSMVARVDSTAQGRVRRQVTLRVRVDSTAASRPL